MKSSMYSLTLFCAATLLATGCGPNADKPVGQTLNNGQQADAASRGENNDAAPTAKEHHYFHKTEKPHAAEWTYTGETGPSHWGDLSPKYVLAKDGKQQSPIDLVNPKDEELPQLELNY
ncbi:MAG: hypothetical protein VXZ82_07740, partial [Planctomycetota bacterium]|nr:hypothetical protein [Planctomycetota bacterium]